MSTSAVVLSVAAALLGLVVTVATWTCHGRKEQVLGRSGLLALLGSVAVGLIAMAVHAVGWG